MITAAVICEYNPFHNGHKYQFDTIRARLKADYIIALMSGDYVERGEPAIFSKEQRAKWALENGADLVLLLPLPYATGSADLFAYGAVYILNKLKSVNYLCFGSESGDIDKLYSCAEILMKEGTPDSFKIMNLMKEGLTFAKARAALFPEYKEILDGSNNVLALEYIQAIMRLKAPIRPVTIKRQGQDYNDDTYIENTNLSSSALRKMIAEGKNIPGDATPASFNGLPEKPVYLDDFSIELYYALLLNQKELDQFLESSDDLKKRILNHLSTYQDFSSFIETLKAKNYTYARLSRMLLHVLLNIKGSNVYYKELLNHISHIKVIGFKESAEPLLKKISERGEIKLLTKIPGSESQCSYATNELNDLELFASTLRNKKAGIDIHEYQKLLVKI